MAWSDHLRRGIFVLLLTPVVSVLTAFAVSAAGVADDQGMAGPATVLVWAAMAALIAFVGGFFLARQIPSARLVQLNLLLAILAGILAVYVGFRLSRQASSTPPADPPPVTRPMSFQESSPDRPMGLGFFKPTLFGVRRLDFYGLPNPDKPVDDHAPEDSLVMEIGENGVLNLLQGPPWLAPAHLKPDYDILLFRVIGLTRDWAEVEVNRFTGETRYVDRSAGQFLGWPDFLLSVFTVEWSEGEPGTVRIKPLAHAGEVMVDYDLMHPIMIRGEWMQVELMNDDVEPLATGWIKWRYEKGLLIQYSLLS